ncbi:hypothetical protein D3OALGA1CA_5638 [Olavius algarvensis associated proteobacterium Delta 3]|nr:hypothetical protein D3OALGB2SA_13 [Olavius algarvensis associated proteobacterium Delta 3]CAB5169403.1 hypothetical protein D3OALGA1CA_5638 [Olavius algarvensis associated proteobacterium Delta 3]
MKTSEAIISFSQSEKVKSGLLWASHAAGLLNGLQGTERQGAERIVELMVDLVGNEALLARRIVKNDAWVEVEKNIDLAKVMVRSGVAQEAAYHLTKALQHVTSIGRNAMGQLKKEGLL